MWSLFITGPLAAKNHKGPVTSGPVWLFAVFIFLLTSYGLSLCLEGSKNQTGSDFQALFIFDYSNIVIPLTQLTHKGIPWNFTDATRNSFQALKSAFISAPVLTHWVPDKPIIIETDASDYALGAILSIQTDSS